LQDTYPAHNWPIREREIKPHGWWNSLENQVDFVKSLERKLNMQRIDDWSMVTQQYINDNGGRGWLAKFGFSLPRALKEVYPAHQWKMAKYQTGSKSQTVLYQMVKQMFPQRDIFANFWYPDLKLFGGNVQYDIYIPSLALGFEYNGAQHCILYQFVRNANEERFSSLRI
jgi:hypothetical protein